VCALAAILLPTDASAAELLLAQPSPCAIGDELSFRAERALGEPLASAAPVRCTVHIERDASGFAARLEFAGMDSRETPRERAFNAPSCETLTDTLAVAVVLAIGSGTASEAEPAATAAERPAPPAPAPPAPAPEVDADVREDVPDEPPPALHAGVRAALAMDLGTLPAPAFGAQLGALLASGGVVESELVGTYLVPRAASLERSDGGTASGTLSFASGSVLTCLPRLVHSTGFALGACVGLEVGALWGSGTDVNVSRSGSALWTAARAGARARWALGDGPFGLELDAGAVVPFERHDFTVQQNETTLVLHRPSAVVGRLSLGVGVHLD
jgi:hypothetical protein